MSRLLTIAVVAAIAAGVFGCSRGEEEEPKLQQAFEAPKRVEQDILRHLEEGMKRNQRALKAQER